MRFSLVLATIGRVCELERFLQALDTQTYRDFELIVVDQNPDDRLVPILQKYQGRFSLIHLRSKRGLSRARNVGLKHLSGEMVAFPDDDCWYPPDLLEKVAGFLDVHRQLAGLLVRSVDQNGNPTTIKGDINHQSLSKFNVWWLAVSFAIFLRRSVVNQVNLFDESLGVGAGTPWGAGEEVDYLLRAINAGLKLYYTPDFCVYHLEPVAHYDAKAFRRAYKYASGGGRVMRKHSSTWFFVYLGLMRPFAGVLFSLAKGRLGEACYRVCGLVGRVRGWLDLR